MDRLEKVAGYLRQNVDSQSSISLDKRVESIKGCDAIKALVEAEDKGVKASNEEEAIKMLRQLLLHGFIVKAKFIGSKKTAPSQLQQAINGVEDNKEEEEKVVMVLDPEPSFSWDSHSRYIWIYEGSNLRIYIYSAILLIVSFVMVMHPLWPYKLRLGAWYLVVLLGGFLGLIMLTILVRFFVYIVTLVLFRRGLWVFPNFTEDVSFVDSFIPLFEWESNC